MAVVTYWLVTPRQRKKLRPPPRAMVDHVTFIIHLARRNSNGGGGGGGGGGGDGGNVGVDSGDVGCLARLEEHH